MSKIIIFMRKQKMSEPSEEGPLQDMELIQAERLAFREVLFKKEQFTPLNEDDFGYSISGEAENYIYKIINFSNE